MKIVCTIRRSGTDPSIAYEEGRYGEAAILFDREREEARERKDRSRYLRDTVWAGICYQLAGRPAHAMALFVEVMDQYDVHPNQKDQWLVHIQLCEGLRDYVGNRRTLSDQLHRLRLDALLCRARGQHAEALARFERAWNHVGTFSLHPYLIAYGAIFSALALGDYSAVQSWSAELQQLGSQSLEAKAAWLEGQARVLLSENQARLAMTMVHELESLVGRTQQSIWQRRTIMLGTRAELLHPHDVDPAAPTHPAWRYLSQSVDGTPEVFDAYDHALLLVDVRLASIRFVLGAPAIDDLYYRQPHPATAAGGPETRPAEELERRVDAFRLAVESAKLTGKRLDSAFHCGWRESELNERIRRADELADWYRGTTQRSEQD